MKKLTSALVLLSFLLGVSAFATLENARQLYAEKKYDEALPILTRLADEGGGLEVLEMLMNLQKEKKSQQAYVSAVKRYLKAGGRINYDMAWSLGNYAHQIKDYESVIQFSKICSALSPNNHSVYNLMGVAYYYLKNYRLSVVALKSAVALSPNEAIYAANLARSYEGLEQYGNAAKYYRAALKNDPNFQRASSALSRIESMQR